MPPALNTRPLSAAALAGLMTPVMDGINMVNAPVAARDHGIDVAETVHDRPTANTRRWCASRWRPIGSTRSVAGTLFAGSRPRIVEIKGIKVEADFAPHMLYVTNQDKPGFIGRFGATLAGAGHQHRDLPSGPRQPGRRCDLPGVGGWGGAGGRAVDGAHLAAGGAGDVAGVLNDGGEPRLPGFHPGPAGRSIPPRARRPSPSSAGSGPRGLASVVFTLLAAEGLDLDEDLIRVISAICLTVLLSVLAHGLSADPPETRRRVSR